MSSDVTEFEGYRGVWRTVGGRHIFIRHGEGLASAMRRSGKFKSIKNKRATVSKTNNTEETQQREKPNIMSIKRFKYEKESGNIEENAKVIASTSTEEKLDKIDKKDKLVLNYDDVSSGANSFNDRMAKDVVEFTKTLKPNDKLYVLCDAGQSRSSAIACAINRKFGKSDMEIWENPQYSPNKTVYKTMLKAFGINESDEEIEKKVKINQDALKNAINNSRRR